jgi:hypothetical protein
MYPSSDDPLFFPNSTSSSESVPPFPLFQSPFYKHYFGEGNEYTTDGYLYSKEEQLKIVKDISGTTFLGWLLRGKKEKRGGKKMIIYIYNGGIYICMCV